MKKKSISNKSISNMNISTRVSKMKTQKLKCKRKRNRNVKTLFEHLRNGSRNSEMSFSSSVISLDDTIKDTEPLNKGQVKRKQSLDTSSCAKRMRSESVVIINDEDSITQGSGLATSTKINKIVCTQTPKKISTIQCSTPIIKKDNKALSKLIVNTFPKNNNSDTIINLNEEIINLTKNINKDSYLTIDLTEATNTENTRTTNKMPNSVDKESENSIIDLEDTTDNLDCSIISVTQPDTSQNSLSGESNVTVLHKPQTNKKQMNRIFESIDQLNPKEKGRFFEFVTEKIFNGCQMPKNVQMSLANIKTSLTSNKDEKKAIDKILSGRSPSRNSVGSNVYHPERDRTTKTGLRMIVIDGSNVAMQHGKGRVFSVKGLKICIDYFLKRGHRVKAFVPRFRCKFGKSTDPRLLDWLEKEGTVVYTPSREIKGRTITPYDDRYIIQCAAEFDGVIVTGDNYRDLINENLKWRHVIENRLLPFTWVDDMIMFPKDPLGRTGPTLEKFLKHSEK